MIGHPNLIAAVKLVWKYYAWSRIHFLESCSYGPFSLRHLHIFSPECISTMHPNLEFIKERQRTFVKTCSRHPESLNPTRPTLMQDWNFWQLHYSQYSVKDSFPNMLPTALVSLACHMAMAEWSEGWQCHYLGHLQPMYTQSASSSQNLFVNSEKGINMVICRK